ncbi:MAG: hypothetical protein RMK29_07800 [Myxococcales bacterium]|nr:hypothetical protein [Myxococcota bacterium]MDW8281597.1 hypothetical protein [Myxococcales bacterium]
MVRTEQGTLFATDQDMEIGPGQSQFLEKVSRLQPALTIGAASGHFHGRGTPLPIVAAGGLSGVEVVRLPAAARMMRQGGACAAAGAKPATPSIVV